MNVISIYCIKTDIVKEDKTKLQVNVIGENLLDAISSASYLKYNGEKLGEHITSVEKFVDKVYQYTFTFTDDYDLNPNYTGESKNKQENLPPTDNI